MKKKKFSTIPIDKKLIIIFVVLIIAVAGFIFIKPFFQIDINFNPDRQAVPKISSEISASKNLFQNNERIYLEAKLRAEKGVESLTVHVYGIEGNKDQFIINQTKTVTLEAGQDNIIKFVTRLPGCFSCAGLNTGTYQIRLEIIKNNRIVGSSSTEISLVNSQ